MSERIIDMPDECLHSWQDVYYPDERDDPMPVRERIVRCRDCRHATINSLGLVKYCEMFVLPDVDGYGANPQVMLPPDFFCGYGELGGDAE